MDNRKTREREERAEDKSALEKSSQAESERKGAARKSCDWGKTSNATDFCCPVQKAYHFSLNFAMSQKTPSRTLPLCRSRSQSSAQCIAIIIRWLGDEMMGRKAATKHTNTQTHFCNSISCFNDEANSETKLSFWCEKIWKIGRICERNFFLCLVEGENVCKRILHQNSGNRERLSHRLPCLSPKHTEKSALESRAFLIFRPLSVCVQRWFFGFTRKKFPWVLSVLFQVSPRMGDS